MKLMFFCVLYLSIGLLVQMREDETDTNIVNSCSLFFDWLLNNVKVDSWKLISHKLKHVSVCTLIDDKNEPIGAREIRQFVKT